MFSIGEFSKITGLTVKTLRYYHEQRVLEPSCVDQQTGYRFYSESKIEMARVITQLRGLDFTLADISSMLDHYEDDADILDYLKQQKQRVTAKMQEYRAISGSLDQIISKEREARKVMSDATYEVEEKSVDSCLIAGIRMRGKYTDCAKGFSEIGIKFGRQICDKPFLLHYDSEYKETDADFEACMPIRKGSSRENIIVRELPGGRCLSLLHKGSYDELGQSYAKILRYIKEKEFEVEMPTREIYIKGPGMIFKGNPNNYLTEIQMLIKK